METNPGPDLGECMLCEYSLLHNIIDSVNHGFWKAACTNNLLSLSFSFLIFTQFYFILLNLFIIFYYLVGSRPTVLEIRMMKGIDGRRLKIIETIAAGGYMTFGMCLLNDENGDEVELIEKDHSSKGADGITQAILKKWLKKDAPTRTYKHLVECLKQSDHGALADDISNSLVGQGVCMLACVLYSDIIFCIFMSVIFRTVKYSTKSYPSATHKPDVTYKVVLCIYGTQAVVSCHYMTLSNLLLVYCFLYSALSISYNYYSTNYNVLNIIMSCYH